MLLKPLAAVAVFLIVSQVSASDLFKIKPYSLKHTNGQFILNFQLSETKKLEIVDGQKIGRVFEFKKDQHYQTELGAEECGVEKDLRILDAETKKVIFSKEYIQTACSTNSLDTEYTFGFISDTQQYTNRHEAIAKVIAYHQSLSPMQFLINGGDVVQNGGKEDEWIEYFLGGKSYLMDIPQIAAIGNHDYRGNDSKELPKFFKKYMRWLGSEENGNLFFDLPGLQLVIWNSNTSKLSGDQEDLMWKGLETKLIAAQKINKPVILATHFPIFSSSLNRFTSISVKKLRKHLVPLAEKYKMPLILSGHTHMYERSFKDGVNYLVAGPAGGRINKPTAKNKYAQILNSNVLTFTKIKYSNKTLKIESFDQDNILIDQLFINL